MKRIIKRLPCFLVVLCLLTAFMPQTALAAGTGKSMQQISADNPGGGISNVEHYTRTDDASYWRVRFDPNVPASSSTACSGTMEVQSFAADEKKPLSENGYSLPGYDFAGESFAGGAWDTGPDNMEISRAITFTYSFKPVLTITAINQEYEYNGEIQGPGDTVYEDPAEIAEVIRVEGLKDGDAVSSVILDGQGKDVGEYDLVPSGAAIYRDGINVTDNYEITYVNGKLKITSPAASYTVSFSAGGSGTMEDVTGVSGEYTLPKCLFTAPENKTFDCWLVDGEEYAEGGSIIVDEDTTVTAKWKDVPPAHVHSLKLVEEEEATCTGDGNTAYYVCDECGLWFEDATALVEITDKSSVIIKALGHKWDKGTVTKEPTETEDGIRTYTCQNDSSHTKEEIIPATGHEHSLTKVDAVRATCTEAGNTAYYVCDSCGLWFKDADGKTQITNKSSVAIKALGHKWDSGVVTKEATYTAEGIRTFTCLNDSSHTKTEPIPKKERQSSGSSDRDSSSPVVRGAWDQDASGWHYRENGTLVSNAWRFLSYNSLNYWYYFGENGIMQTGWLDWKENRYYLYPVSDGWMGRMLTGWQLIDGKWYYFETAAGSTQGRMYRSERTPDGYYAGADGAWDGNPANAGR